MEIKDEASRIDSPDKDIKISPPLTENAGFDFSKYSISEKIGIFGIGGAGCNIIDFIYKKFKFDNYVSLYAVNTDAQSLQRTDSNISRIILGKKFLLGRGSGGNPDIGANAVSENVDEFKEIFKKLDFIFLIAGLGKGTGSGSTGEIAKIAKEMNKLVVCYLTKPSFEFDGEESYNNSCKYSNYIYSIANSSNIILNSRVLQLNGELIDFTGGYEIINDLIGCSIKLLVDIINKPAKINLDFNDISNFFKKNNKFNILSFEIPNE
ncbi:hypothetical protein FACS189459_2740 [Bacilli bacterium]|nr:hypothetical protein FACS189459_2740 [Bacilli bacterium]GHU52273.1 hypothetical protein FACS189496_2150 [Bacilli bacterium]